MKIRCQLSPGRIMLGLTLLCVPISALYLQAGGILHTESAYFICNYLAKRPLINKIFDPLFNDWGLYQAREFSYLIDWLDVQFIAWCARLKICHFYSLSFVVISILIIAVQQYCGRKLFRHLTDFEIGAASLLLISTPTFLLNGNFYRSAKPLCTLFMIILCYLTLLLYYTKRSRRKQNYIIATYIIMESLLAASDRQGVFWVAVFAMAQALLLTMTYRSGERADVLRKLAFGAAAVIAASAVYNRLLCPALIKALNNYDPDFTFQQLPQLDWNTIGAGISFFWESMGIQFGGSGIIGGIAGTVLILAMIFLSMRNIAWRGRRFHLHCHAGGAFLVMLAAAMTMFILMEARHPLLSFLPEMVFGTYAMPVQTATVFFLTLALNLQQSAAASKLPQWLTVSLLLGIAFINFAMLPAQLEIMRNGHLHRQHKVSSQILRRINASENNSNYGLMFPSEIMAIRCLRNEHYNFETGGAEK